MTFLTRPGLTGLSRTIVSSLSTMPLGLKSIRYDLIDFSAGAGGAARVVVLAEFLATEATTTFSAPEASRPFSSIGDPAYLCFFHCWVGSVIRSLSTWGSYWGAVPEPAPP